MSRSLKGLDGECLALDELERPALYVLPWRQALHECVGRDDQAAAAGVGQLVERLQPLGDDVRVRGEQVVRQHFPIGEPQQRQRARGKELQLRGETFELACPIGDQHVQPGVGAHRFRERERRSAAVELMPAKARCGTARGRGVEEVGHRISLPKRAPAGHAKRDPFQAASGPSVTLMRDTRGTQ